jgi:hypothetical protein
MKKQIIGFIVALSVLFGGTIAASAAEITSTGTTVTPNSFVDPGTGGH